MSTRTRDVYVVDAVRTPIGRYNGALASVRPDDLAAHTVRALLERTPELDPARVGDVVFGNANGAGEENRNVGRMAALLAGLPSPSRASPSTGCAPPAWRPWCRPRAPSPSATTRSSSPAASSR